MLGNPFRLSKIRGVASMTATSLRLPHASKPAQKPTGLACPSSQHDRITISLDPQKCQHVIHEADAPSARHQRSTGSGVEYSVCTQEAVSRLLHQIQTESQRSDPADNQQATDVQVQDLPGALVLLLKSGQPVEVIRLGRTCLNTYASSQPSGSTHDADAAGSVLTPDPVPYCAPEAVNDIALVMALAYCDKAKALLQRSSSKAKEEYVDYAAAHHADPNQQLHQASNPATASSAHIPKSTDSPGALATASAPSDGTKLNAVAETAQALPVPQKPRSAASTASTASASASKHHSEAGADIDSRATANSTSKEASQRYLLCALQLLHKFPDAAKQAPALQQQIMKYSTMISDTGNSKSSPTMHSISSATASSATQSPANTTSTSARGPTPGFLSHRAARAVLPPLSYADAFFKAVARLW